MDHFERFGLPRRFAVDGPALERAYLERSRAVHPDFHELGSVEARSESLAESAAVNQAYTTLKDLLRRAEYLWGLLGGDGPGSAAPPADAAFLMEVMDLRERADDPAARADFTQEVAGRLVAERERLAAAFTAEPVNLAAVRAVLDRVRTLQSLSREITGPRL